MPCNGIYANKKESLHRAKTLILYQLILIILRFVKNIFRRLFIFLDKQQIGMDLQKHPLSLSYHFLATDHQSDLEEFSIKIKSIIEKHVLCL
jgi:hypothetical protein